MAALDVVEPQSAGQRLEDLLGHGVLAALFQAAVVVGGQPREPGQFLLAQARYPPRAGERRDSGAGRGQAVAAGTQERREGSTIGAVGGFRGHTARVGKAALVPPGHGVPRQHQAWCDLAPANVLGAMTSTATSPGPPRTALVTGSTSGIGAATARALAADGVLVVVTGRDKTRGDAVVTAIEREGGSAVFAPSELTGTPDELRAFARRAVKTAGGHLDIVVHNAALCPPVDTVALSDTDLEATLAVNVRAPHVLTAALAPAMVERGHGAIVVIGSWMATIGHDFVGLYSATKAAEEQLARSWSAEFGPRGVRVNTVAPGATRTPINDDTDEVVTRMTAGIPAGRPGTPHDVAVAVAWLVSDQAAYVHATTLAVDGGITSTRTA